MATSLKSYEKKYKALEDIVRQLDDGELSMSELLNQICWILWKVKSNRLSKRYASESNELC